MFEMLWGMVTGDAPSWLPAIAGGLLSGGAGFIFLRSLKIAALAGAVVAVLVYVGWTQAALATRAERAATAEAGVVRLTKEVDDLADVNDDNQKVMRELQASHARDLADARSKTQRAKQEALRLQRRMEENANDPDAQRLLADACPALDRWFDSLRDPGGGAADGNTDGAGPAEPPARAPGVRPGAPAPHP